MNYEAIAARIMNEQLKGTLTIINPELSVMTYETRGDCYFKRDLVIFTDRRGCLMKIRLNKDDRASFCSEAEFFE